MFWDCFDTRNSDCCVYCQKKLRSLSVSVCLSLCLCLSLPPLSLCLSVFVSVSLSPPPLSLSVSLSVSLSLSLSLCLSLCLSLSQLASGRNVAILTFVAILTLYPTILMDGESPCSLLKLEVEDASLHLF